MCFAKASALNKISLEVPCHTEPNHKGCSDWLLSRFPTKKTSLYLMEHNPDLIQAEEAEALLKIINFNLINEPFKQRHPSKRSDGFVTILYGKINHNGEVHLSDNLVKVSQL